MSRSAPARSQRLCLRSPSWCWRRDHDAKERRTAMRRPRIRKSQKTRLRAGMPQPVEAHISSGGRIVGTIGLHAVSDVVTADGSGSNRNGAVIVVLVIIVARRVIARPAIIIAVALRRDGAADHGTCNRAGDKAAAAAAIAAAVAATITAAAVTDAITSAAAASAATKARPWSATTD